MNCTFCPPIAGITALPLYYLPLQIDASNVGSSTAIPSINGNVSFTIVGGKSGAFFDNSILNFISFSYTAPARVTFSFWYYSMTESFWTAISITNPSMLATDLSLQFELDQVAIALPMQWTFLSKSSSSATWSSPYASFGGTGRWIHVALSIDYNSFAINLYVNGTLMNSAGGTGKLSTAQTLLLLGKSGENARAFGGYLRQLVIYPVILTPAQIFSLAQFTDATACSPGTYYLFGNTLASSRCIACPNGTFNALSGQTSSFSCFTCPLGSYCVLSGASAPLVCPTGAYCSTLGLAAFMAVPCIPGFFCPVMNQSSGVPAAPIPCPSGTK